MSLKTKKKEAKSNLDKRITSIIKNFTISTNLNCKIYDMNGEMVAWHKSYNSDTAFCNFINKSKKGKSLCNKSRAHAGKQIEVLETTYYIYYCPFGLVNIVVPILKDNKPTFYIIVGPFLIHKVDDLMLEEIIEKLPELKKDKAKLKDLLKKNTLIDTVQAKYIADLILKLVKIVMVEDLKAYDNRHKLNIFHTQLVENIKEIKTSQNLYEEKNEKDYLWDEKVKLTEKVKTGDKEGAKKHLNQLLGYIFFYQADDFEKIRFMAIELLIYLSQLVIEAGADYTFVSKVKHKYLNNLISANDFNKISRTMLEMLDYLLDSFIPVVNIKDRNTILIAINYMRENYHKNITLETVAAQVGLHPVNFGKAFKNETGKPFTEFLNELRITASKSLLREDLPLVEVAFQVGFNDQSYFSKIFKKFEGVSPKKWAQFQKL